MGRIFTMCKDNFIRLQRVTATLVIIVVSSIINFSVFAENTQQRVSKYDIHQIKRQNSQADKIQKRQSAPTTKTYFALKNTTLKRSKTIVQPAATVRTTPRTLPTATRPQTRPTTTTTSRPRASSERVVIRQPETAAASTVRSAQIQAPVTYQSVKVGKDKLSKKDQERFATSDNDEDSIAVPFSIPNTLLLKLKNDISEEEIDALFEKHNFEFVKAYEAIGTIKVKADLSKFYAAKLEDGGDPNVTLMRGLSEVMTTFSADHRIISASPDVLLSDKNITNLLSPSDITVNDNGSMTEVDDWGIADIQVDQLWSLPEAHDGTVFGVFDVGFNRHEDIVFIDIPEDQGVDDHGNHVAGIACGKHNGKGIRGVLPNCFVRPRSGVHVPVEQHGGNVLNFMAKFSQVLAELNSFIVESKNDVTVLNVSLGYNWRSNFDINPDVPESGIYRALVQSHGEMLFSVLEILNEDNVLVFSAAGNDSTGLDDPIDAKYSSPFNYAALIARERGVNNAFIVEAHDKEGKRAPFSNEKGDISCPGVDIMSAIARVDDDLDTSKTYATMSGTSMASPYCASTAALLSLVTDSTLQEVVECMTSTGPSSDSGAPRLKAKEAFDRCTN